jgi:hypothetical protein
MRNSPFAIFRKHQKALMVALTLMAMFAFVFLDAIQRNARSGTSVSAETAVQTSAGNLSNSELSNLVTRRRAANQFVERVFVTTHPELARVGGMFVQQQLQRLMFGFGRQPLEQDVLLGHLLRLEAQQHGIVVSDQQIESYLDRISENKLTSNQFKQIVGTQRLTSKQVYDFLRDELQARMALQMEMPFNPLPPERYWRYFKQLNVKQQLEVAAIPIRQKADSDGKTPPAFIDKVPDPGDAELEKFFEQHKSTFEQLNDDGKGLQPGFRQPRRVRLNYISLDYKSFEESVAKSDPVTDAQIAEHYEKNKDARYRVSTLPAIDEKKDETKPLDPEFTPEKNGKDKPADGEAKKSDEKKPDDEKKADEKKSEDAKPPEDKPAEKKEPKDDKQSFLPLPSGGEGRGEGTEQRLTSTLSLTSILRSGEPLAFLLEDDEKKSDAKNDEMPADKKPADESKSDKPADDKKPDASEKKDTTEDKKDGDKKADEKKTHEDTLPPPPAPKYRELDDDLKQEIQESLQRERTLVVLRKKGDDVSAALRDVGLTLLTQNSLADVAEDRLEDHGKDKSDAYYGFDLAKLKAEQQKQLSVIADTSKTKLEEIAAKHGGTFGDTGLVSGQELSELKGLGEAAEHSDNPFQPGRDIIEQAFSSRSLCLPQAAEAATTSDLYVHWKIRDDADYVASFKDSATGQPNPAIRKQVLDAWKFQQAQPLAKKRADELAELARKGEPTKSLKELLADQTVTGDEGSPTLAVNETPAFSWLRESAAPMSNPFASRPPPQMSSPAFFDRPGTEFMETVFDKLNPGEIGVVANVDHSVYYIVKVTIRNEPDHAAFMKANLFGGAMGFFFATPYDQLAIREQQQANYEWSQSLEKKYAVKWSQKLVIREDMEFEE